MFEKPWQDDTMRTDSGVSSSLTCLPPRSVAEFLIQMFFKYCQTNDFYVEETYLYNTLNACYDDRPQQSSIEPSCACIMLMILAMGTRFAHMESPAQPSRAPIDHIAVQEIDASQYSEDALGLTFYRSASQLLPAIVAASSLRSVQACLLIGTYLIHLDTSGLSYIYFGLALRIAVQNGMHRKYRGKELDSEMVEVRNRVFWTSYALEKYVDASPRGWPCQGQKLI